MMVPAIIDGIVKLDKPIAFFFLLVLLVSLSPLHSFHGDDSSADGFSSAQKSFLLLLPNFVSSTQLFFLPFVYKFQWVSSGAPTRLNTPLAFCSYNGSSCCNATDDAELQKQFSSMNISDSACGSVVKLILCTKCDPYSSDLFTVETKARKVPVLCNNAKSNEASVDFCNKVWNTCKNEKIQNSLFSAAASASASEPISSSKLTDHWKSSTEFCKALGGSADTESICFNGTSVSFKNTVDLSPPQGICVEKIGNGSYLSMEPHPDGSNRVFLSDQAGLIWLASVPTQDSGGTLDLNESNIFLDLTDMVHADTEFGVMGLAFHPNFTKNGRFFVSFNCDKVQVASCSGRCSCNSEVGCDPSKLDLVDGDQLCRYQSVVSEFTANSSSSTPSEATSAIPSEVRRIFTMGLPYTGHHAGQILFGPEDGYLYFMMGDGGNKGDPFNFAQNKKSVLGKIMRLDVNKIPSSSEINDLGLWGNYSIPKDNPSSADDSELLPEIWALGLRNPWRCSFDSKRPSYFFCADVGEPSFHESMFYLARFVYADLYGEAMWAGIENPKLSGIYNSTKLPFSCAKDTPIACEPIEGSSLPSLGIVYSFAEDNDGEIYILASKGVFRIVRPSRCNYSCASESHADIASPPLGTSSSTAKFTTIHLNLMLFLSSFIILFISL
ncbi:hypothetical protein IEQ34_011754 [Dendrobium chrysotoxum]|uniref:Glucose/Sorbosone dehydrogenase domain-containing protein n=1 Tax=Dendrobium chrysotoxum TaxID=161865 RepID=A0AAV7GB36_DENCH|nr:hypothetical protein IEQ34_011754 [Dendrobium chrysotoxum]